MRINYRLTYFLTIVCLVFLSKTVNSQTLKLANETAYLTEILTHTSENDGRDVHFIGWLLNTTSLSFGDKHSLNIGAMLTHGGEPSVNIVGDLQTFSNLEAGSLYGFNEIYYQYQTDDFWLKFGQQDINTDFFVSENALLFTHSSFGIDPVATLNMPAPTYPVTGASITTGIRVNEHIKLKLGIFDGQFADINNNYLTINWDLNKDEGLLYIIEPEFSLLNGRLTQKVGYYYHSGQFTNRENQATNTGLSAFYLVSDYLLSDNNGRTANLFLQFDTSTKTVSDLNYYYGLGLRLTNYLGEKPNELGLALGYAKLNNEFTSVANEYNLNSETIIEINYKREISNWLSIQPYFHWINMNEITEPQRNPVIFALRAYIAF